MKLFGSARSGKAAALAMLAPFVLAACGSSGSSGSSSSSSGSSGSTATTSGSVPAVATLQVNKTAQILAAAPSSGSKTNEATFVLTALGKTGKPVANAPVRFYIGPMVPLSGHPPTSFTSSSSSGAAKYIASSTPTTDAAGQATITLLGQPADTMEMIGVKVGKLSTFNVKKGKALGALDAWWTAPTAAKAPPVGAYVTTTPFAAVYAKGAAAPSVKIAAMMATGPITGATVSITPKTARPKSSSSMGASSSGATLKTSSAGSVTYPVTFTKTAKGGGRAALRIVVTQANGNRVAGGMVVQLAQR